MGSTSAGAGTPDQRTPEQRRADVIDAALALFAEGSFDEVTAEQIAARANVSRRTFFYYFPSKADVLFSVHADALAALRRLVAEQPAGLSEIEAVEGAWAAFTDAPTSTGEPGRARAEQLLRAAAGSVILRGRQHDLHTAYEEAVASGLADRRGLTAPDDEARLAAALAQAIVSRATRRWLASPKRGRAQCIRDEFARAGRLYTH